MCTSAVDVVAPARENVGGWALDPAMVLMRSEISSILDHHVCSSQAPSPLSLIHLDRHPELWFDDGNIVLIAQQTGFRFFRGLLASQSTFIADMFASATSQADETLSGCSVVRLTDSHLDLAYLHRVRLPAKVYFIVSFSYLRRGVFPLH